MIVCIDAIGIRDGGGVSVLTALIETLPPARPDWNWIFLVDAALPSRATLPKPGCNASLQYIPATGWSRRLLWLCRDLSRCADRAGAHVIFSLANISPLWARVPNVLFVQQRKVFEREVGWSLKNWLRFAVLSRLVRRSMWRADRIFVQTTNMRDLIGRYGVSLAEKTVVIPSPVRTFHRGDEMSPALSGALATAAGHRLLYVSLAREHKNHAALIVALATLRRRFPSVCLWLTVAGPNDPSAQLLDRRLHKLAEELEVTEAIQWLGLLKTAEVAEAYAEADLTVFPSLNESYGLPLAESILAGTPVCASDLPYAWEICGDAAIYFDPNVPQTIAATIGDVLDSEEVLADLRARTLARARRLSPGALAERLCRELDTAARKKML